MNTRDKLLNLFNQYSVEPDELSEAIAKDFRFKYSKKNKEWTALPRDIMGESISALFQKFLKMYKKHYRVDVAVKYFYQLTDDEISEMFDELPYYLETFKGREQFKPNAASFLKEKIWQQDYPNKIKRDRTKKSDVSVFTGWDEFILSLPANERDTYDVYRTIMSFDYFKRFVLSGNKER